MYRRMKAKTYFRNCWLAPLAVFLVTNAYGQSPYVHAISKRSSARMAGIREGDQLITYNGRPVTSLTFLEALRDNQAWSTSLISIGIRRGRVTMVLQVEPRLRGVLFWPDLPTACVDQMEEAYRLRAAADLMAAIVAGKKAAAMAEDVGNSIGSAWVLSEIGSWLLDSGVRGQARQFFELALKRIKGLPDATYASRTYRRIGRCAEMDEDFSLAVRSYSDAKNLDEAAGLKWWIADDMNDLGAVALATSRWADARKLYSDCLHIREKLRPGSPWHAGSLIDIGNVIYRLGRFQEAYDLFSHAAMLLRRAAPRSPALAIAIDNMGQAALDLNSIDEAFQLNREAMGLREQPGFSPADRALSYNNQGRICQEIGDIEEARRWYSKALELWKGIGSPSKVADVSNNLGVVLGAQGADREALSYLVSAEEIYSRTSSASPDIAMVLLNMGYLEEHRGNFFRARQYYGRALKIRRAMGTSSLQEALILTGLGLVAMDEKQYTESRDLLNRALKLKQALRPDSRTVAVTLLDLGALAMQQADPVEAESYFRRAQSICAHHAPRSVEMANALNGIGVVQLARHMPERALPYLRRAIDLLALHRNAIGISDRRSRFTGLVATHIEALAHAYVAVHNPSAAFETVEAYRARGIADMLAERSQHIPAELPEMQEGLQSLLRQIASARRKSDLLDYGLQRDRPSLNRLYQLIDRLVEQKGQKVAEFRRLSPRYAAFRYPQPLSLAGVQAILQPGTLLLYYLAGEGESLLFAITQTSIKAYPLHILGPDLRREVQRFHTILSSQGMRYVESASKLYHVLVHPADKEVLTCRRIVISPDGPLSLLPFAALVDRVPVTQQPPHYFIQTRPIHQADSASLLATIRENTSRTTNNRPPSLVVFADPAYTTPTGGPKRPEHIGVMERPPLASLRESAVLARDLCTLQGMHGQAFVGAEANRRTLEREAPGASDLVLAVHGLLDERDPLNSALALSPESETDSGNYHCWEVMERLQLHNCLVALCSCNAGLGEEIRFEGIVGLRRAMHYAGARVVLAPIWSVPLSASCRLVREFFRRRAAGRSVDESLQSAQIAAIQSPNLVDRHPYHWAAFILSGDADHF